MSGVPGFDFDTAWLCVCHDGDGAAETTRWITQDGADEYACEIEQEARRARRFVRCEVMPASPRD